MSLVLLDDLKAGTLGRRAERPSTSNTVRSSPASGKIQDIDVLSNGLA